MSGDYLENEKKRGQKAAWSIIQEMIEQSAAGNPLAVEKAIDAVRLGAQYVRRFFIRRSRAQNDFAIWKAEGPLFS